jgi:hypothetical protein
MTETRLNIALEDIRGQSGFDLAVLTDLSGNILALSQAKEIPTGADNILLKIASQIAEQAQERGASLTGESEFFDWDGRRIVCRWFEARIPGVLVVLVPKGKSYKWAVGRMVKEVQRLIGTK